MNLLRIIFKIVYLSITYVIGGVDRNYYHIMRGNYFADLKIFNYAIHDLKIAHNESKDPNVEAALGWCYSQINKLDTSLKYYRMAYNKTSDPEVVLGLAYAEYYNGNIDKAKVLIERLSQAHKNDANLLAGIIKFQEETQKWEEEKTGKAETDHD